MLSIHDNLSAGTQNVADAYVIMLVYRRLLITRLHGKQQKLFVTGYRHLRRCNSHLFKGLKKNKEGE